MIKIISFDQFIPHDGTPIYQQIVKYIKSEIISGVIQSGDEFPSRRVLSALLGVNPNTIQKVCRLLEDDGLMKSRSGSKSYMSFDSATVERLRVQLLEADALAIIDSLKQMGLSKNEALALIDKYWE